jgi:hypothetical protein
MQAGLQKEFHKFPNQYRVKAAINFVDKITPASSLQIVQSRNQIKEASRTIRFFREFQRDDLARGVFMYGLDC